MARQERGFYQGVIGTAIWNSGILPIPSIHTYVRPTSDRGEPAALAAMAGIVLDRIFRLRRNILWGRFGHCNCGKGRDRQREFGWIRKRRLCNRILRLAAFFHQADGKILLTDGRAWLA